LTCTSIGARDVQIAAEHHLLSQRPHPGGVGDHRLEEADLGREVLPAVGDVDRGDLDPLDGDGGDPRLQVELGMEVEGAIGGQRLTDQQRDAGVTLGAVPVRPVSGDVAHRLGNVVDGGLDLLKTEDVRLLARHEVGDLVLSGADPVDVPGGNLHRSMAMLF